MMTSDDVHNEESQALVTHDELNELLKDELQKSENKHRQELKKSQDKHQEELDKLDAKMQAMTTILDRIRNNVESGNNSYLPTASQAEGNGGEEGDNVPRLSSRRIASGGLPTLSDSVSSEEGSSLVTGQESQRQRQIPNGNNNSNHIASHGQQQSSQILSSKTEMEPLKLPEDTYGFFVSCKIMSRGWCFGLSITLFQITLFLLFLIDILSNFDMPADVDGKVRAVQIFALLISIFVQDDLLTGIALAFHRVYRLEITTSDDYHNQRSQSLPNVKAHQDSAYPNTVEPWKWYFSAFIRGIQGLLSLAVSFVLIVQADNVFDLLLNFTAVLFLSELDDIAFKLADIGFFGSTLTKEAHRVKGVDCYYRNENDKKNYRNYHKIFLLSIIILLLYIGFFAIIRRQESTMEYYACKKGGIHVEFGDVVVPSLGIFTGTYNLMNNVKISSRVVYENEAIKAAKFGFCNVEERWTFFYKDDDDVDDLETADPCGEYQMAKSSETHSFDLMETASDTWFSDDNIPLDYIQFICDEPTAPEPCQDISKNISEWCPSLLVSSDQSSGFAVNTAWNFEALEDGMRVHKHPVYKGEVLDDSDKLDLIFFTGRRWVLTDTIKLNVTDNDLVTLFQPGKFDASKLPEDSIAFMSDAVYAASETCSPVGLTWHHVKHPDDKPDNSNLVVFPSRDPSRPIATVVSCSKCNNDVDCNYGGVCLPDGKCDCINSGATGPLCGETPLGDGICDSFFNTEAFQYDGGDCCGATCASERCGLAALDFAFGSNLTFKGQGFPNCIDDSMVHLTIAVENVDSNKHLDGWYKYLGWEGALQLICDATTYLNIPIGTRLRHGTNLTVSVKDGTSCDFTIIPASSFDDTRVRITRLSVDRSELTLLDERSTDDYASRVMTKIFGQFDVVSTCIMEDIFGTSPIPETSSAQYKAILWLGRSPLDEVDGFKCNQTLLKQRYALAVINYAFDNVLQVSNNWLSPQSFHCTEWSGVICDEDYDTVQLILENTNLIGTIPSEVGYFSSLQYFIANSNSLQGTIPSEVGAMTNLEKLALSNNDLTGLIPSEVFYMTSLVSLLLDSNRLTGTIPTEVGDSLEELSLNWSGLTGTIPIEVGSMTSLASLSLAGNGLTGTIPTEVGDMMSLKQLWLYENQLTGMIPTEVGAMTSLVELWLALNELTGTIPTEVGAMTSLEQLWLHENQITGAIPTEVGAMTSLEFLVLRLNELTGAIPTEVGNMTSLTSLLLHENQLTGTIPIEVGSMTSLASLWLEANGLTGTIPTEVGAMPSLTSLSLDENQLTGTIPTEVDAMTSLEWLVLDRNQLNGTIPTGVGAMTSLTSLSLDENQLTGTIPTEVGAMTSLVGLRLAANGLTGTIPTEVGDMMSLKQLWLYGNQLNGMIPTGVGAMTSLTSLSLYENQLTGTIPTEVGAMTSLVGLRLHGNQLNGTIPTGVGAMTSLTSLSLYGNQLAWTIPTEVGAMTSLVFLRLDENQLNGTIPTGVGAMTSLALLSLDKNQLTGTIPTEVGAMTSLVGLWLYGNQLNGTIPTGVGSMTSLVYLRLDGNQLNGMIPTEVGAMTSLEGLWLYGNQLTGTIPTEVESMTKLTSLDLSYNDLNGTVPSELTSFLESLDFCYLDGNPNLDGVPDNCIAPTVPIR